MDDPGVDAASLRHAMRHLELINGWLNGYGPSLWALSRLMPAGGKHLSLLDVGCGSGDTLRYFARWARRRGIEARLVGVELSPEIASIAKEKCAGFPEIEIRCHDLFDLSPERYDVAHCALMLHHFPSDDGVARVLRRMAELARRGVIANDLHRHWLAYHSIKWLTRTLSRSPILRNDAPLSVARAFTREELGAIAQEAGLARFELSWHWAFRWMLLARLEDDAAPSALA